MKILAYLGLILLCGTHSAGAMTITDLFAALKKQPITELDTLQIKSAELGVQSVYDRFYPELTGILGYERYSSPTNWRPVVPTETVKILANHGTLPFSDALARFGGQLSLPLFVKELFSLGNQAESLADSSRIKQQLNLFEHQAVLVTADAHLVHMSSLKKALDSRKISLEKTRDDVANQVRSGRLPESELVRMDEAINLIDLTFNQTMQQESGLRRSIESLTGIFLREPVALTKVNSLSTEVLLALKPLEKNIEASEFGVQAAKDKLYPKVVGTARWFQNYGEGYNTGEDVDGNYGSYGISLQMPIFSKPAYTAIEKAKIDLRREKNRFAKARIELQAKAGDLSRTLGLLDHSKELAQKSVDHERELLKVAKVAYGSGRLVQEEYLRNEEKVLSAEASYYLTEARWWETFATLAVLYGNNLEELVK
ncbi:MAG: TolC family protein [Deltaproteobacteria bacterium]|nr:TolC family protein [Deltaproteobacteria bacterium]MBW2659265.1 TolC family protein [Deltaproteobacteria bacterium]